MTPVARSTRRAAAIAAALLVTACGPGDVEVASTPNASTPTASATGSAPDAQATGATDAGSPTSAAPPATDDVGDASATDRPVLTPGMGVVAGADARGLLTDEQLTELEGDCCTVIAAAATDGGVVAAIASSDGENLGASIESFPRELLSGGSFGGSGELLLPEDSCNFESWDDGWTVVVTRAPGAAVAVTIAGERREVVATPVTVDGQDVGVVLIEGSLAQTGPRPSADPGGPC